MLQEIEELFKNPVSVMNCCSFWMFLVPLALAFKYSCILYWILVFTNANKICSINRAEFAFSRIIFCSSKSVVISDTSYCDLFFSKNDVILVSTHVVLCNLFWMMLIHEMFQDSNKKFFKNILGSWNCLTRNSTNFIFTQRTFFVSIFTLIR